VPIKNRELRKGSRERGGCHQEVDRRGGLFKNIPFMGRSGPRPGPVARESRRKKKRS